MTQDSSEHEATEQPQYGERTPADYLATLEPALRSSFTPAQLEAVERLLESAIPKPVPKLVDLRFWVDLLAYRFYVVLFVGKDRRRRERSASAEPPARPGNAIAALMLLLGLNLLISLFILLIAFAIKSAIGYSLLPASH